MKPNSIKITYKDKNHVLNRVENKYYQIGFESDRWRVHIYLLKNGQYRVIISKSVKKGANDYHTQFHYDCYCLLVADDIYLNDVCDPATCKRIMSKTKWLVIEPMIREIYTQLKAEIKALHQFDLIHDFNDLKQFIFRNLKEYNETEYIINNSLRFGIGENAYTTTEEAYKAKEKEPIALLYMYNGYHIISVDTIVFFLYWLLDRDNNLTISDGERTKTIVTNQKQ